MKINELYRVRRRKIMEGSEEGGVNEMHGVREGSNGMKEREYGKVMKLYGKYEEVTVKEWV